MTMLYPNQTPQTAMPMPSAANAMSPNASSFSTMNLPQNRPVYSQPSSPSGQDSFNSYPVSLGQQNALGLNQDPSSLIIPPHDPVTISHAPNNRPALPDALSSPEGPWYQVLISSPLNGALSGGVSGALAGLGIGAVLQAMKAPAKVVGAVILGAVGLGAGGFIGQFNQSVTRAMNATSAQNF